MSTPAPTSNEPSKMRKILSANPDQSVMSKLPRANGDQPTVTPPPTSAETTSLVTAEPPVDKKMAEKRSFSWRYKFLPAFWTIASVMSFTVNIVLLIVVLLLLTNPAPVGSVSTFATDQVSQLLGGLYNNFVLMDEANIQTNIHVEKEIPVQFNLLVSAPADVTLREDVVIDGALVTVATGGLNITNARARIVLPAGQPLPINISNLVVPVDQKVLAVLDVPVDIPLNQTELHEPFVGLQKVVEPWYCLTQPDAQVNGSRVCDGVTNPLAPVFNLLPHE